MRLQVESRIELCGIVIKSLLRDIIPNNNNNNNNRMIIILPWIQLA